MNVPETYFSVEEELLLFFASCAAGAVIGVVYDCLRAFRLVLPHNRFFVALEDIAMLVCYGIFISAFGSAEALGYIRGYFILGNLLGFALYYFTLGRVVMRTISRILAIFRGIFRLAAKPFRKLFQKRKRSAESSENRITPETGDDFC
ncbi:MAG: spore cortex biosynthesis protein YabQ [Ruminococcus sp.]|nr:spore cortex biosynthesis protein YabQ [Ruminococcus sp.]